MMSCPLSNNRIITKTESNTHLLIHATERVCPDGWWRRNRRCYRFGPNPGVYTAAVDTCGSLGGTPFVPNSQAEFAALGDYAAERGIRYFWLGCEDLIVERTFDCFDGSQILESSRKLRVLSFDGSRTLVLISRIVGEILIFQKISLGQITMRRIRMKYYSIVGSRLAHLCLHRYTHRTRIGHN